jgi:hypothetical protein
MHAAPLPETARSFAEWLHRGRYVLKGAQPTSYRLDTFEPLYTERQTAPLPAIAPPTAATAPEETNAEHEDTDQV